MLPPAFDEGRGWYDTLQRCVLADAYHDLPKERGAYRDAMAIVPGDGSSGCNDGELSSSELDVFCLFNGSDFSRSILCPFFQFSATSPQQLYFRRNGELSNLFHFVFILVFGIGPTLIGLGYNGSNRSYSSCSSYNSYCLLLCPV